MILWNIEVKDVANYLANSKIDPEKTSPDEIVASVKEKKSGKIGDEPELLKIAEEVIRENEKSVADYRSGKESAIQALIGGMMRKTQGKAEAGKSKEVLIRLLGEK
jgi:aspartyl-tRNA(Asn)/glutamyl-tRNA(Gln) amidotransferase subunit B